MTSLYITIIAAFLPVFANAQANGLEFSFKTGKKEFAVGEPVVVTFVWKNASRKPLRIEQWRSDARIQVFGPDGKPARFVGMIHDFSSRLFMELKPGQIFRSSYTIAGAQFGPYELTIPGKYRLASSYSEQKYDEQTKKYGEYWTGSISAPDIQILIREGTQAELLANRTRARTGDKAAIQFLALNRDVGAVADLEAAFPSGDYNCRSLIASGLASIGTDAATEALSRLAKTVDGLQRTLLIGALGESKNRSAIPLIEAYLTIEDSYTGELTRDGRKYKNLITRRAAARALYRGFSIKVPEEVYEVPMEPEKK